MIRSDWVESQEVGLAVGNTGGDLCELDESVTDDVDPTGLDETEDRRGKTTDMGEGVLYSKEA